MLILNSQLTPSDLLVMIGAGDRTVQALHLGPDRTLE